MTTTDSTTINHEARKVALLELLAQIEILEPDLSATHENHIIGSRCGQALMKDRIVRLIQGTLNDVP